MRWSDRCRSCRGLDGYESNGPQGWIPGPCKCHPAREAIDELSNSLGWAQGLLRDVRESANRGENLPRELLKRIRWYLESAGD